MGRLYVLILFICLVSSEITAQSYNKFLDKLCDYQDNVRLEEKLVGDREFRDIDTNTFNLKDYMSIFSKLIPEPRYILEYIYNYSWDGGIPLLYARRDDFEEEEYISTERERIRVQWDSIMDVRVEKIENEDWEEEEKNKRIERIKRMCMYMSEVSDERILLEFAWDSVNHAVRHLIPEDSKMGYFQLLIFKLYNNNFALWWHANYSYRFPVYKKEQIEFLIERNRRKDFSIWFDEKNILSLLKENLDPRVKMEQHRCVITLYEFYAGSGLYRNVYSISRVAPYTIKKEQSEKLVSNDFRGFY